MIRESGTGTRAALLIGVLGIAAVLRFAGLQFGMPLDLRPDERVFYADVVARMAAEGSADPGTYAYPQLPYYSLLGALKLFHLTAVATGHPAGDVGFAAFVANREGTVRLQRVLAAFCGLLTVLVVWRLGRAVGGDDVGLVAALMQAVAPLAVRQAHFGVVDAPATLAVTVALWLIVRALQEGTPARFAAAGVAVGLAAAMRYLPAVLLLPLIVVVLAVPRGEGGGFGALLRRRLLPALAGAALAFVAGAPYTLLRTDAVVAGLRAQAASSFQLGGGAFGDNVARHLWFSLGNGVGLPIALLAAVGVLGSLVRGRAGTIVLLLYAGAQLALISTASTEFVRYALPLVPVVAVLAAGVVMASARVKGHPSPKLAAAVALAACLPALYRSVHVDRLFVVPSSLERLQRWLDRDLPAEARLCFTSPNVQRKIRARQEVVPFDPTAIAFGAHETWMVVTRHPHPLTTATPRIGELLDGPHAVREWHVRAARDPSMEAYLFDRHDAFWFSFARPWKFTCGGPDVAVWRVIPRPAPEAFSLPPPEPGGVDAAAAGDRLGVVWDPGGPDPLAWAVRRTTLEALDTDFLPVPLYLPGGVHQHVFHGVPPGTWWVSVSAVGFGGESPLRVAGPVEVKEPGDR